MVKAKKRKVMMRKHSSTLPEELKEHICLIQQLREQEREKDPSQFYLDDPPLSIIWRDAIVIR